MASYGFRVYGIPTPQGSKNSGVSSKTGKSFVYEQNSEKLKPWRSSISEAALAARGESATMLLPIKLTVTFWIPRPRSISVNKRPLPSVKPDLDKLVRAVGDALKDAGVYKEDSQIVQIQALKNYAVDDDVTLSPGAWIVVSEIQRP